MGSSGSGRFSDYPASPSTKSSSSGGRSGSSGGSSGEDPCDRAFSTELEDFERSEYFGNHKGTAPKIGTTVTIEKGKRVIARASTGETLGNLPTKFNYLAGCMAAGRTYIGRIVTVSPGLIAKITIDAAPK